MRRLLVGISALTLMCAAPAQADGRPSPSRSALPAAAAASAGEALPALLAAFEPPSRAVVDALQRALDDGWPSNADAALLDASLTRNTSAIDAFRCAAEGGAWVEQPATTAVRKEALSRLRLAIAWLVADGLRAVAAGQGEAAARDLQAVAAVARTLVAAPSTSLRMVGLSTCARTAVLARRAGLSVPPLALPTEAALVAREKAQYLAAAEQAATLDGSLRPHILAAAARLVETYYEPLSRPLPIAEANALHERFVALYSELGSRYGEMEPRKVLELIPVPVPSPARLGETMAAVVLCAHYLDMRQQLRLRDEAARALASPRFP